MKNIKFKSIVLSLSLMMCASVSFGGDVKQLCNAATGCEESGTGLVVNGGRVPSKGLDSWIKSKDRKQKVTKKMYACLLEQEALHGFEGVLEYIGNSYYNGVMIFESAKMPLNAEKEAELKQQLLDICIAILDPENRDIMDLIPDEELNSYDSLACKKAFEDLRRGVAKSVYLFDGKVKVYEPNMVRPVDIEKVYGKYVDNLLDILVKKSYTVEDVRYKFVHCLKL